MTAPADPKKPFRYTDTGGDRLTVNRLGDSMSLLIHNGDTGAESSVWVTPGYTQLVADAVNEAAGNPNPAREILRIVSDWCIEANDCGGVDAGDLAWRLEDAGYPLPGDEED